MDTVRMGYVSAYDEGSGMASIFYPDRDAETATSKMPVFCPFGINQKLLKDDAVLVLHLSNGSEVGIIIGTYAQDGESSGAMMEARNGDITMTVEAGQITISDLIRIRDSEIPRLWEAIEAAGG